MKKKSKPATKRKTIIGAAVSILKTWGPQRTPGIIVLLEGNGIKIKGKRPIQTLYGVMRRNAISVHPLVRRNKKGYWILV